MTEHYRLALLRVVAELFVLAGMTSDSVVIEKLPRHVRNAILLVLRPAESAARRLVAAKAKKLDLPEYIAPPKRARSGNKGKARGQRPPQFNLIDPRKFFAELHPNRRPLRSTPKREASTEPQIQVRIAGFDGQPDFIIWSEPKAALTPDDEVTATAICRRILALKLALENLPKQAKRYVREVAKRRAAPPGVKSRPPLRTGFPPGYRKRQIHEVDQILRECNFLVTRKSPFSITDLPPHKAGEVFLLLIARFRLIWPNLC